MLLCFGFAWPISLRKSWISRTNSGKSVVFLLVVVVGYASGIIHKVLHSRDFVIALYALNMAMVSADIVLWFRNDRQDRAAGTANR